MKNFRKIFVYGVFAVALAPAAFADFSPKLEQNFIEQVAPEFKLTAAEAKSAIAKAQFQSIIIDKMTKPAEGKPFGDYRKIILTPRRVQAGKAFITNYPFAFNRVRRVYGVPPEMVSAILGVETFYGKNTGSYRVLDALATLAFGYPKRAGYFQQELGRYIALSKKNNWPVENLKGSYAGAFGWPQFMPTAYVSYAVTAYPGARPDLYNPNDAILSVANYFKKCGWIPGGLVAVRVKAPPYTCSHLTCGKRKPMYSVAAWRRNGVKVPKFVPDDVMAGVVTLHMDDGPETWMIFHNFYVITCYNISVNYAMSVYELSQAIRSKKMFNPETSHQELGNNPP